MDEHQFSLERPHKKRPANRMASLSLVILAVLALLGSGLYTYREWRITSLAPVPGQGYQAVFLEGGQVYFGKLSILPQWVVLSDVYYLQSSALGQAASNFQLVKLGSEIYGPEDTMYIERSRVLYWENIKGDSKISQAIDEFKKSK